MIPTNVTFIAAAGKPKAERSFQRLSRERTIPVSYFKSGISTDKKIIEPFTKDLISQLELDGYEIDVYFK